MEADRTIVVGGGIAGLSCAAALANAGRPVLVLEASRSLGGRGGTRQEQGYRVNQGGHALYPGDERRLAALGVRVSGGHPRPDRGSVLWRGELSAWPLPPSFRRSALTVRERAALLSVLAGVIVRRPERLEGLSAADWINAHAATPAVAGMLAGLLRISSYGGRLDDMPAEVAVGMVRAAAVRPVRYIDGGWQSIVDGLAERVRAGRGQIETGARVEDLLCDAGGTVEGVRTDAGREYRAGRVVIAGLPPARAGRMLTGAGGGLPQIDGDEVTAACLDLVLHRLIRGRPSFALGLDEPLYLSAHSPHAQLAPDGGAVVHLMRYGDGQAGSDSETRQRLEELMDLAQPGWRDQLIDARFAPRMTVTSLLPRPGAGLASRPAVTDTGLNGVLIAGDWVGPTGWLVGGSVASGAAAAETIIASRRSAPLRVATGGAV